MSCSKAKVVRLMTKALTASISLLAFLCASVVGTDSLASGRDEVAQVIHDLNPYLSAHDTQRLVQAVHKARVTDSCQDIPWRTMLSVAFKESSLRRNAINHRTKDYGLMQINAKNILRYGLSRERLLTDEAYALEAGCKILSANQARYAKKIPYWIGLYRSGTALWRPEIRENAKQYARNVELIAARITYGKKSYRQPARLDN